MLRTRIGLAGVSWSRTCPTIHYASCESILGRAVDEAFAED